MKGGQRARNERAAFTLIEVIVAAGLAAMVLSVVLLALHHTTRLAGQLNGRVAARSQARLILDRIEADLTTLVWRREGADWLVAELQADQPSLGGHSGMAGESWSATSGGTSKPTAAGGSCRFPENFAGSRFGQAGVWLRLFANQSDGNGAAQPVAIGYQLVRRRPADGLPPEYQLLRVQLSAAQTFATGYTFAAGGPYELADASFDRPGNLRCPPADAVLATGVVDFGVRFVARTTDGDTLIVFPERPEAHRRAIGGDGVFPVWADVFVRIVTEEGAVELTRLEEGLAGPGDWWERVEAFSYVFTRRIHLRVRAL